MVRNRGGSSSTAATTPSTAAPRRKTQRERPLGWQTIVLISAALAVLGVVTYQVFFTGPTMPRKMKPITPLPYDNRTWGTYRSHMYFGLRTRHPASPLFGVMWYEQPDQPHMPKMRHWCDQGDGVKRYGWWAADGRTFGRQNLSDIAAAFKFDWVNHKDTFTARIKIEGLKHRRYTVILYMASESQDRTTKYQIGHHLNEIITGNTQAFGEVKVVGTNFSTVYRGATSLSSGSPTEVQQCLTRTLRAILDRMRVKEEQQKSGRLSVNSPQVSEILHTSLVSDDPVPLNELNNLVLMNTRPMQSELGLVFQLSQEKPFAEGRFAAVQLNVQAKTELLVRLSTRSNSALTAKRFNEVLDERTEKFKDKFEEAFQVADKNYTTVERQMASVALSNMIGSIGYWYGSNKVQVPGHSEIGNYGPHRLFSGVPSRPFFPRGFLWDEGFHHVLISHFDYRLTLEVVTSWLNTMSEDGWIPREMILGQEAEAKVPAEYVVQRTNMANPPSWFYVMDTLTQNEKIVNEHRELFLEIYPKLGKWYKWLKTTQKGPLPNTFRWRGRNGTTDLELNPKTLASGLDDYPRASHPGTEEYHLDLRCWMALGSRVMARLSKLFATAEISKKYSEEAQALGDFDDIVKKHWSREHGAFFDFGRHSLAVDLVKERDGRDPQVMHVKRRVKSPPQNTLVSDAFGYNSLFPLMMRLLPIGSEQLKDTLNLLDDPKHLWSEFGLRSISKQSPYYAARNTEHDPPYWRGYIWINMNYLVLSALQHYAGLQGEHQERCQELVDRLRRNLVSNMGKQFNRTGYLWENYDDRTGEGRGTHPFTGWSSLILLVMSDSYEIQ